MGKNSWSTTKKIGVKNMSDLTAKEIKGIYNSENTAEKKSSCRIHGPQSIEEEKFLDIHEDLAFERIAYSKALTSVEFRSN